MDESIVLHFFHEAEPLEINAADPDSGVILGGETSAYPITGGIGLTTANDAISKNAVDGIRQIEDWPGFRYSLTQTGDTLRISGAGTRQPRQNLPPIGYEIRVDARNTRLRESSFPFRLGQGEAKHLNVVITEPSQCVIVPESQMDAETLAILRHPDSGLDGATMAEWFARKQVRTVRKVCVLNLLAKLRALPHPTRSLSSAVESIFFADIDRTAMKVTPEFVEQLEAAAQGSGNTFKKDTGKLHATHERLLKRVVGESEAGKYKLTSYRENVGEISLQIILGEPKEAVENPIRYAEFDIDLFNPFADAVSFFGHVGELLDPGKTNHFDLASKVPSDFRYYTLRPRSAAAGANG